MSRVDFSSLQHIDDHARRAPLSVERSVESLAAYLSQPARNDLEVVRANYVWICDNIRYDTDIHFGKTSIKTKAEDVLKYKTSVCGGYSDLFNSLCRAQGIPSKKISGYSKGSRYRPGDIYSYHHETDHSWNIVKLGTAYYLVDATWGSGYVDKNGKFVKKFDDFYFLTPPKYFIMNHFPYMNKSIDGSKLWQLLLNPVSLENFSRTINPSREAMRYGIEFPSHPYTVVQMENFCCISLTSTSNLIYSIWYDFYDRYGRLCNESVIILQENELMYKIIVRPKQPGRYTLQIHATIENCNTNSTLVEYIVECISVVSDAMPYPKHHGYYGYVVDFKQRGFQRSNIDPYYRCKNGEFILSFKTTVFPDVLVNLENSDGIEQDGYILTEVNDYYITVKARLTKKGFYKLTLFNKFEKSRPYTAAMNILILNSGLPNTPFPFPVTYSTTTKFKCHLIAPLVRNLPAYSTIQIQFICPTINSLMINGNVYSRKNGDHWNVTVKTTNQDIIKVSGKPANDKSYWTLYEFSVIS